MPRHDAMRSVGEFSTFSKHSTSFLKEAWRSGSLLLGQRGCRLPYEDDQPQVRSRAPRGPSGPGAPSPVPPSPKAVTLKSRLYPIRRTSTGYFARVFPGLPGLEVRSRAPPGPSGPRNHFATFPTYVPSACAIVQLGVSVGPPCRGQNALS